MPRKVAHNTNSWATRMRTEESISPCGGRNKPRKAKIIVERKEKIASLFFISFFYIFHAEWREFLEFLFPSLSFPFCVR